MLRNPLHFLALGFGSGLAPFAPGTFGTLASIPLYLLLAQLALPYYLAIVVLGFGVGVYLCHYTSSALGVHDHSGIVWDEFVGFWITMIAVPVTKKFRDLIRQDSQDCQNFAAFHSFLQRKESVIRG